MDKKKTIVFTGGGSAGHVTPNIAIINELDTSKWDIHYIGSYEGIEKDLIGNLTIPYHGISSGKLRRYFDRKNFTDTVRVLKGILGARKILKKVKPKLVFSKGGFVTVPVVIAAKSLKIPVFLHESDITPGLANKIANRFATRIFTSFEEAAAHFPQEKATVVGSPIRKDLFEGNREKGLKFLDFDGGKPVLTIMGGSLGAKKINETVRGALPELLAKYQIVHLCGKNNLDDSLEGKPGYRQFEYVHGELADILAVTDFVITRGGSNAIFEFLNLRIPMLIIPLTRKQSRGDQILNAKSFQKKGYSLMLEEEDLHEESLLDLLANLRENQETFKAKMSEAVSQDTVSYLIQEMENIK
ncbi:undecaprenyldiphospho-muramoylpentapeptide beta-N-acetylglucosaminyltransferase [Evansella tamaricis]|uniref:UDP-N-acetylglucosamine--N-acetylmuramyl-(pentapeptide) pyrophosphoryl-undecaprenol N-acetylglucosamine transferase n=1 Tax=Evansella tamaricis TaxID=2069301 RepID=A0ABS6JG05_9BACI|nr:undecaprenyldiphospho-muramoylpentapeptide beta-N-acetylglucosaminyltransferase [Evansella tamaricis]MBU9712622.1 undecaprenyldiphospho-muramoylpentapeptide beta-N-acetylglucosaminyltransferase [Evansella tamaricis]